MNLQKLFFIPSMALLISSSVAIDFNASELDTTSETISEQATDVVYAPSHPTSEEVEDAAATDLVTFNDANLEQALADKLGVNIGEITVGDMESLASLDLWSNQISDITGLEYATNVTNLILSYNQISDITPLAGLTSLTSLKLNNNQISDITPLAGLTSLASLDLWSNQISDISPLSGLIKLSSLNLWSNQISDISPLSGLTNLTFLNLSSNQISDISPLSGLTSLTGLYLAFNQVSDISPLSGLTSLTGLYLLYNQISDISPLAGLTNLTNLSLNQNSISDISPLSGLTNLFHLYLSYNQISDISPLAGLTNLTYLDLDTQTINLEDITVDNNDELFHTIIDIDGIAHQVSLGVPQDGTFVMTGEWFIPTSIGPVVDAKFNGTVRQTVNYGAHSTLTGTDSASTTEETTLTDEALISLFDVVSSNDLAITVDDSAVDYSTPGSYDVVFTDTDGNKFTGTLTVTDVLPTLTIDNDTVTLPTGSTLDDVLSNLVYSATEITDGDLTGNITVDDSAVDYSTPGSYDVVFTVVDAEGNEVSKTVTVIIEDEDSEPVDPETPEVTDPEGNEDSETVDPETPEVTDPEGSEDTNDDTTKMSLATTGGKFMGTLAVLLAIVIVALGLKRFIKE